LLELNPDMGLRTAKHRQFKSISLNIARPFLISKDLETRGLSYSYLPSLA
jgi:hypothetical protein